MAFWAEKIADEVIKKYQDRIDAGKPIIVRDEKTASGRVHVGSLRSASLHAIVHEVLKTRGIKTEFHFEINDFDPLDGIPSYLDEKEYLKYMGMPLCAIPSPEPGYENFAELYGQEYVEVLNTIGFTAQIYRASELYKSGKVNDAIRAVLEKRDVVRNIYKEVSGSERSEDWYPLNVVCEECGKISSTKVTDFDGKTVAYVCSSDTIEWAEGCGYEGRISPFDGNAKLPWKLDWPAKWLAKDVQFEGGGKDHFSKGGSRDVANAVSTQVFEHEPPHGVFNEFFLVGGKKMSSSKGNAASAIAMSELLSPHMLRLLLLKSPINRQIDFDPEGDAIPVLFDTYDRLAEKTWSGVEDDDTQLFLYSHTPEERTAISERFLPRFSQIAFLVQMPHMHIAEEVALLKGSELTDADIEELSMRAKYAKKWLKEYADEKFIFKLQESLPEIALGLTNEQKDALKMLADKISESTVFDGQSLHELIHSVKESSGLEPKVFFGAIYMVFLGKESGPKIGWLLSTLDKQFVFDRLTLVG